jgi:hypothetical protein
MRWLRRLALLIGFLACLAPVAHLLELPNKLQLDGPLWLAVQQHLYRGWGPLIGAPTELGGLIISLVLLATNRRRLRTALLFALAVGAYIGMLLSFFLLNAPVNEAVNNWTPGALPVDWASYRLQWEIGHALAALFALLGLAASGSAILGSETFQHNGK